MTNLKLSTDPADWRAKGEHFLDSARKLHVVMPDKAAFWLHQSAERILKAQLVPAFCHVEHSDGRNN